MWVIYDGLVYSSTMITISNNPNSQAGGRPAADARMFANVKRMCDASVSYGTDTHKNKQEIILKSLYHIKIPHGFYQVVKLTTSDRHCEYVAAFK